MTGLDRTDSQLIDAIRAGDDAALSSLLGRYAPTVMRFAMKLCRNEADAEDVLQDTLLAAARGVRDLRGGAAVSTWLYTVARSFCIKKRRKRKDAPDTLLALDEGGSESVATTEANPEQRALDHEIGAALERALASLDESAREVIVLRDIEGLSAAEAAEVLETSVDAVKSRLHRARATLRTALMPLVSSEPKVPSDPACPDVVDMLSRHLEGEIDAATCASMEAHVASCASCSKACDSLRSAVAVCKTTGGAPLSASAAARVRSALARIVENRHAT